MLNKINYIDKMLNNLLFVIIIVIGRYGRLWRVPIVIGTLCLIELFVDELFVSNTIAEIACTTTDLIVATLNLRIDDLINANYIAPAYVVHRR